MIGNGPAALSKKLGREIDEFQGQVWRINAYEIKGFEDYVGTRVDVWVTVSDFPQYRTHAHKKRYYVSHGFDLLTEQTIERIGATRIPKDVIVETANEMGYYWPSTGAIITKWLLDHGHEVWLWGFNFLEERQGHHYSKNAQKRGKYHSSMFEWLYFNRLYDNKRIRFFGQDTAKESIPIVRAPVPCGKDDDVSWYREAAHNAWYLWIAIQNKGCSFLDIGAGLCEGMKVLEGQGSLKVDGFEVDPRLADRHKNLFIGEDLSIFESKSYDVVTCVDVIEHVVEDLVLLEEMKRIARKRVYVTTPNYTRSRCGNIAHCREYTMPQFMNLLRPNEIWSGSPDGSVHRTLVMHRENGWVIDHSPEGVENRVKTRRYFAYKDYVPLEVSFSQTVDFEEWAHICGIWNLQE